MDVNSFKELPIMGIVRGAGLGVIEQLTETVISSGLKTIEITMNTSSASKVLRKMVDTARGRLTVGAGTVITVDELKLALDAGATFIVSPTLIPDVAKYCVKNRIPVFPGALTPQEIYNAWRAGATMVKVFPAKFFGPDYFSQIKGPFNDIELLAASGITPDNIKSFFSCGASAVAFGGSIFRKDLLETGNFSKVSEYIKALIAGFTS